jgi:hypothetical protein
LQVIVRAPAHDPDGVAETSSRPAGNSSVKVASASFGPLFVAVSVKVTSSPTSTSGVGVATESDRSAVGSTSVVSTAPRALDGPSDVPVAPGAAAAAVDVGPPTTRPPSADGASSKVAVPSPTTVSKPADPTGETTTPTDAAAATSASFRSRPVRPGTTPIWIVFRLPLLNTPAGQLTMPPNSAQPVVERALSNVVPGGS